MKRPLLLLGTGVLVLTLAIGATACGGDDDEDGNGGGTPVVATATEPAAGTPSDSEATTVDVNLLEYQVVPDPTSAAAGDVTFNVSNIGGVVHEFVIVQTDLAAEDLPTADDGSFDAEGSGPDATVVDEIKDIDIGDEQMLTATLEAGNYLLLCNVVDETTGLSHFAEGMHTTFTVE